MADFEAFRRVIPWSIKLDLFSEECTIRKKNLVVNIVNVKIQIEFLLILFRMEEAGGRIAEK